MDTLFFAPFHFGACTPSEKHGFAAGPGSSAHLYVSGRRPVDGIERGRNHCPQITLSFSRTSISAEERHLGLECTAHKIPRRWSSEIAFRPPVQVSDRGHILRSSLSGLRKAASETARNFEHKDRRSTIEPEFCESDRKSECPDHDGSFWRFPVSGLPRVF